LGKSAGRAAGFNGKAMVAATASRAGPAGSEGFFTRDNSRNQTRAAQEYRLDFLAVAAVAKP